MLDDEAKGAIRAELARLLTEFEAGRLEVDHLGMPSSRLRGWALSLTPRISSGESAFHFRPDGDVWFDHHALPLPPDVRAWFVDAVHAATGQDDDGDYWNDAGSWVSVKFRARRA